MKNNIILAVIVVTVLVGCKAKKEVATETETTEPIVEEVIAIDEVHDDGPMQMLNTLESFEYKLLEALTKDDFGQLKKFMPTVAVSKGIAGEEVAAKTDREIQDELLNPLVERTAEKFTTMRDHLIENGIELKEIGVKDRESSELAPGESVMMVLNLDVGDNKKYAQLSFMYAEHLDEIYLFDIIMSLPVIKDL